MDREELLKERENNTSKETKIPLVLTYNRSLPNISKVVYKHWKHFIYKQSIQRNFSK